MSKTCLISGASGGVATALARRLRDDGWRLALVGRARARLVAASDDVLIEADVSQPEEAERAVAEATAAFGGPPRGYANCAGASLIAPLSRTREAQYRECLRANLDTCFFGLQAWISALTSAGQPGAAVVFSSVAAGVGVANHAAVAAAKGAVEALSRSLAADLSGQGIRINSVAPGLMRTGMTARFLSSDVLQRAASAQYPLGRHGQAEDAAGLAAFLLSDQAAWITGQTIAVDGGFLAVRPYVKVSG